MDRLIRLQRLWSWLPAFRAVAETEHLHDAANRLHLTPSTLSRAIHLLEDDIGRALFSRVGRGVKLTDEGRALATTLREAMRRLDDTLVAIGGARLSVTRIACNEQLAAVAVIPALVGLRHPISLTALGEGWAIGLRSGALDVAFATVAHEEAELVVERIGELRHSIYDIPGAATTFVHADELPWPAELPREIGLRVQSALLAVAACRAGLGRAMLPDRAAAGLRLVGDLPSLGVAVYAIRRAGTCPRAIEALVDGVRATLGDPLSA